MKKMFVFAMALSMLMFSCKKDNDIVDDDDNQQEQQLNPVQQQWGFTLNYTATWCTYCGSWGADKLHELSVMNSGKVLSIAAHASGDPMYVSSMYTSLTNDRKTGGGIPAFWVGDEKVTSSSAVSKMNTLVAKTPIAAIDMKTTKNSGSFAVKSKVKFFAAGTGDYYLSFFILEDGILGNAGTGNYEQDGTSNANYKHDFVLRKTYATNAYGELLATNPAANATYDKEITFEFNTAWTNTLYVGAAIWKYNPNGNPDNNIPRYEFVNGFVVK
ncbi:MAG: hypothetical protein PHT69_08210 [Bacteroidales bacterium]|nr:hypothetical protein [Bacteroidales bacterium]